MGGKGGGRVGTCELQAHEEGGEANKGGHMGGGAGAPGTCYVGEHVVVRALGGYGPLFVVAEFFKHLSPTKAHHKGRQQTPHMGSQAGGAEGS